MSSSHLQRWSELPRSEWKKIVQQWNREDKHRLRWKSSSNPATEDSGEPGVEISDSESFCEQETSHRILEGTNHTNSTAILDETTVDPNPADLFHHGKRTDYENDENSSMPGSDSDNSSNGSSSGDERLHPSKYSVASIKASYQQRKRMDEERERKKAERIRHRYKASMKSLIEEKNIKRGKNLKKLSHRNQSNECAEHFDVVEKTETCARKELEISGIIYSQLCCDIRYKRDILLSIRNELKCGKSVHLTTDTNDTKQSVGDAKLALQYLCTECLQHCDRGQDMLPTVDEWNTKVSLRLCPKKAI